MFANNAATGTPIAVINYTLNTDIIVNGSSPARTAGDTDSLTLRGTSGNDVFDIDLTRLGRPAGFELITATDGVQPSTACRPSATSRPSISSSWTTATTWSLVGRDDGRVRFNIDGGLTASTN